MVGGVLMKCGKEGPANGGRSPDVNDMRRGPPERSFLDYEYKSENRKT